MPNVVSPADPGRLTRSDILPLLSSRRRIRDLVTSQSLWVMAALMAAMITLYVAEEAQDHFVVIALVLLGMLLVALRAFMRSEATLLPLLAAAAVQLAMLDTPLALGWIDLWHRLFEALGGSGAPQSFVDKLVAGIIRTGIPEDTLKVVPLVVLLLLSRMLPVRAGRGRVGRFFAHQLDVRRPTTMVMIALASAAAFVLYETVAVYVWHTVNDVTHQAVAMAPRGIDRGLIFNFALSAGEVQGFELLFPRLLGFLCGHGAYAAVIAYAIAIAVHKTRGWSRIAGFLVIVPCGILIASTMHALWNVVPMSEHAAKLAVAFASGVVFVAIASKARRLDHALGFAASRPMGDSLVLPAPLTPASRRGAVPRPHATLVVEKQHIALEPDAPVDLAARIPALKHAAGVGFALVTRAGDPASLGLRNLGRAPWRITTAAGRSAEVAPGRVAALAEGLAIDFGTTTARVIEVAAA
jgi:RsiW-degrading membrane proteinase PrsW (M82 family)